MHAFIVMFSLCYTIHLWSDAILIDLRVCVLKDDIGLDIKNVFGNSCQLMSWTSYLILRSKQSAHLTGRHTQKAIKLNHKDMIITKNQKSTEALLAMATVPEDCVTHKCRLLNENRVDSESVLSIVSKLRFKWARSLNMDCTKVWWENS